MKTSRTSRPSPGSPNISSASSCTRAARAGAARGGSGTSPASAGVAHGGAGDRGALELQRLGDPPRQLQAARGRRAQCGEASGEQTARGTLRLEDRAQREQVVAQRLERVGALAAELESAQRPGE